MPDCPASAQEERERGAQGSSPSKTPRRSLSWKKGERLDGRGGGGGVGGGAAGPGPTGGDERRQVSKAPSRCRQSTRALGRGSPLSVARSVAMRCGRTHWEVWQSRGIGQVAAFISSTRRRSTRWPGPSTVGGAVRTEGGAGGSRDRWQIAAGEWKAV